MNIPSVKISVIVILIAFVSTFIQPSETSQTNIPVPIPPVNHELKDYTEELGLNWEEEPDWFVYDGQELLCLQKNIYWEARNQTYKGKVAVATVTINRVLSPRFPDTICGVVKQTRRTVSGSIIKHQCAFSWYCDGLSDVPRLDNKAEAEAWARAGDVARMALSGRIQGIDIMDATHYHANYVSPWWSRDDRMVLVNVVEDHTFYKEL